MFLERHSLYSSSQVLYWGKLLPRRLLHWAELSLHDMSGRILQHLSQPVLHYLPRWYVFNDRRLIIVYPVSRRVHVSTLGLSMGSGAAIGQSAAALLGPSYGWPFPFLVVAIPAIACAVLLLASVQDPPRGGFKNTNPDAFLDKGTTLASSPSSALMSQGGSGIGGGELGSSNRDSVQWHPRDDHFCSEFFKASSIFQTRTG